MEPSFCETLPAQPPRPPKSDGPGAPTFGARATDAPLPVQLLRELLDRNPETRSSELGAGASLESAKPGINKKRWNKGSTKERGVDSPRALTRGTSSHLLNLILLGVS